MRCDVVGILCHPQTCEFRRHCEPHRKDYDKAELMTENEIYWKSYCRIKEDQQRSLGKNPR